MVVVELGWVFGLFVDCFVIFSGVLSVLILVRLLVRLLEMAQESFGSLHVLTSDSGRLEVLYFIRKFCTHLLQLGFLLERASELGEAYFGEFEELIWKEGV